MKIAVVGCGGIGGVVSAVLASKGAASACIEANEDATERINRIGVNLEGKKGKYSEKVMAQTGLSSDLGKFDVIVIAVKSGALRSVFSQAKDYLTENGFILTLQNGLEIDESGGVLISGKDHGAPGGQGCLLEGSAPVLLPGVGGHGVFHIFQRREDCSPVLQQFLLLDGGLAVDVIHDGTCPENRP